MLADLFARMMRCLICDLLGVVPQAGTISHRLGRPAQGVILSSAVSVAVCLVSLTAKTAFSRNVPERNTKLEVIQVAQVKLTTARGGRHSLGIPLHMVGCIPRFGACFSEAFGFMGGSWNLSVHSHALPQPTCMQT